jgi:hypothetical protein
MGKKGVDRGTPGLSFIPVACPAVAGELGVAVVKLPGGHSKGIDPWFLWEVGCQGKKVSVVSSARRSDGKGY